MVGTDQQPLSPDRTQRAVIVSSWDTEIGWYKINGGGQPVANTETVVVAARFRGASLAPPQQDAMNKMQTAYL